MDSDSDSTACARDIDSIGQGTRGYETHKISTNRISALYDNLWRRTIEKLALRVICSDSGSASCASICVVGEIISQVLAYASDDKIIPHVRILSH